MLALERGHGRAQRLLHVLGVVAHRKRNGPRHQVLVHQVEHEHVHHLAHHRVGLVVGVGALEHLALLKRGALRHIGLDLRDGAGLHPMGVVDEVLGVHAELPVEQLGVEPAHAEEVVHAVLLQARRDARPHVPDVGDGAVRPDLLLEGGLVEDADAVGGVLGQDVEGHLCQEEVGAHAGRGADALLVVHGIHEHLGQARRVHAVEREVGRHVDEALVDGVDVDVLGGNVAQVDGVDVGRDLHVAAHARRRGDVLDALGYLEHPAAVADAQGLHGRGDGQADGLLGARGVGHHEVGGEGVKAALGALHGGVERLEIDADVGVPRLNLVLHGAPPLYAAVAIA